MENPTKEEILKAVNDSGYLFEQEIGTILERNNFYIQPNVAFIDIDEEKSREIDVMGYKRFFYDEEKKISIGVRILCVCKNNTNPFVFICRNKNDVDKNYSPPNFLFPHKEYKKPIEGKPNSFYTFTGFKYFNIETIYPYSTENAKATQFCKIIRKGKDWSALHDGIYDNLLIPMIKCLDFYKKEDSSMIRNTEWKNYVVYYPIIVLNSDLYSINANVDTETINKIDFVHFTREINSKKLKDRYLVDFVTKEGLQNYIENNISYFMDMFVKKMTESV